MSLTSKQNLVKYATYLAVLVAFALVATKFVAWIVTGSVSMLSSLVDSLLDLVASTCNLLAVRYALSPADKEHRFGHGKAEGLIALAQSAFITGSALFVLLEASSHAIDAEQITHEWWGVATMGLSIALTYGLLAFQRYVVNMTHSVAISADALHYKGDLYMNLAVMVALMLTYYTGIAAIDTLFGSGIAIYLLWNAWKIIKQSVDTLMDKELPDNQRERIIEVAMQHPDVKGVHDLRTRRSGLIPFIQLHLEMDGDMNLLRAHDVAEDVENSLLVSFPDADIIIHQDPLGIEEKRLDEIIQ